MRRLRRKSSTSVDLIGFLDILSTVMVIVLIVISVLSLSLGVSSNKQADRTREISRQEVQDKQDIKEEAQASQVELVTIGGQQISGSAAFLLCRDGQIEMHDPGAGTILSKWDLSISPPHSIIETIRSRNAYIAVAGSCFSQIEGIVNELRSSGIRVGYEPIADNAKLPWE